MPNVKVNGITLGYDLFGDGEPLILLIGMGWSRRSWFLQTRFFKKHFKTITCDNRGVGSTEIPDKPYTIRTMAEDVIGLMNYLKIKHAHILGVSMGGMIAQQIAINYPERVKKLVLGSTYVGGKQLENITKKMRVALGLKEDFSQKDARDINFGDFMKYVAEQAFNSSLYKNILGAMADSYINKFGSSGFAGQLEAVSECDTIESLRMITAPTLVITGTEDRIIPVCVSEMITERIPCAKLVKIRGGSHTLHIEMNEQFNSEVLNFLS